MTFCRYAGACLAGLALFVAQRPIGAHAAEPGRCRDLTSKFEMSKPQITAMEVSLALFSAADRNCVELATRLLDQGASVEARDRLGARPLGRAAMAGHLEMVDLLLARGAPLNARDLDGATALYQAAARGQFMVVQRLIERGADVNLAGHSGVSPVAAAAYAGRDSIVKLLLEHGADSRAPDDTGKPPVVYAAPSARLDILKQLVEAGHLDLNARYANDLTLLMWACGPDENIPEAQAIEVVSYLLQADGHIDDRDARGRTALMTAAEGNHARIVDLLLAKGADPSLQDKAGKRAADLTTQSALRARLTPH